MFPAITSWPMTQRGGGVQLGGGSGSLASAWHWRQRQRGGGVGSSSTAVAALWQRQPARWVTRQHGRSTTLGVAAARWEVQRQHSGGAAMRRWQWQLGICGGSGSGGSAAGSAVSSATGQERRGMCQPCIENIFPPFLVIL
jgi:hypothetical protein